MEINKKYLYETNKIIYNENEWIIVFDKKFDITLIIFHLNCVVNDHYSPAVNFCVNCSKRVPENIINKKIILTKLLMGENGVESNKKST